MKLIKHLEKIKQMTRYSHIPSELSHHESDSACQVLDVLDRVDSHHSNSTYKQASLSLNTSSTVVDMATSDFVEEDLLSK